ncbi:MAG: hypothetical protein RL885_17230 [Planctomycetota bacterium]
MFHRSLFLLLLFFIAACGSTTENRDPTGERFPSVVGESLSGEEMKLPGDLAGKPALLLIGYVQDAQFDLDRWLLGLMQAGVDIPLYEVPTIDGLVPGMIAGSIDEGMRSGIPKEDWGSVVTVYGDADQIVAFTGDENPRNGRIVLLDADGKVAWFHDRGYSARLVLEIQEKLKALR